MHTRVPIEDPCFPEDDNVQKRPFVFFCFFSRNKAVHVDYFDFKVRLDMPFF